MDFEELIFEQGGHRQKLLGQRPGVCDLTAGYPETDHGACTENVVMVHLEIGDQGEKLRINDNIVPSGGARSVGSDTCVLLSRLVPDMYVLWLLSQSSHGWQ